MNKFWKWTNKASKEPDAPEERSLYLYGTVASESWLDDEISPAMFRDELNAGTGPITVYINSPGGDCVAASQIYTMLMDYKGDVNVKIDGIAASAASVIAMAGTNVQMAPTALMMIHNPATTAYGDHKDMQRAIDLLAEVKESIINAYEIKTGMSRAKLSKLMDAETWMDAHSAINMGFADEIMQRKTPEEEDPDAPEVSVMFSQAKVTNSLLDKLNEKFRAKEPEEPKTSADSLLERLDLIKNWR